MGLAWRGPSVAKNHDGVAADKLARSASTTPHVTQRIRRIFCVKLEDQRLDQRISSQRNGALTPHRYSLPLSDRWRL